jgi:phage anti-repressor protein
MIKIIRNNFDNWIDIRLDDKLIDNVKTRAVALEMAKDIQLKQKQEGRQVEIKVRLKD